MRYGFTTGSCAAAASKAAAYMLLTGKLKQNITIQTPKGILFQTEILEITRSETEVTCAVRKDGGDDPDITSGTLIFSTVRFADREKKIPGQNNRQFSGIHVKAMQEKRAVICIDGGKGVGRVTKPGLDQPVGNAAINHVPREMIEKEVREVCALTDETADLLVEISVPEGETLAAQTFNPRLGITGGISILGTSGIVEPMSSRALLETIRVELNQKRAMGYSIVAVSPGNYGLDYMKRTYGYDLDKSVKCSNFIGDTIDMAVENGFEAMLLTGHIGKLIKVAGGIMNTHSQEGDCRMELITSSALSAGADADTARQILSCVTTEEAVNVLKKAGLCEKTMELIMQKIMFYLNKRAAGKIAVACILYSNEHGGLGESAGAAELLARLKEEKR
jgi:cobalt-precorrin-5B (C1)-methyltransferase